MKVAHLALRFFGSLRPGGPNPQDQRWVEDVLSPAELVLWQKMSNPDRRHGVKVARRVQRQIDLDTTAATEAATTAAADPVATTASATSKADPVTTAVEAATTTTTTTTTTTEAATTADAVLRLAGTDNDSQIKFRLADVSLKSVLVAALLHDVGKIDSSLRTPGRVLATICWAVVGRSVVARWHQLPGWKGEVGRYLRHPDRGAELLSAARSDTLAVAWCAQHHLSAQHWSIPVAIGEVLRAADND